MTKIMAFLGSFQTIVRIIESLIDAWHLANLVKTQERINERKSEREQILKEIDRIKSSDMEKEVKDEIYKKLLRSYVAVSTR